METQTVQPTSAPLAADALAADATTTSILPITLQPPYLSSPTLPSWSEHRFLPRTDLFWYARGWNPTRGEIVMQLGTKLLPSNGVLYGGEYRLGFTYRFTATRDGYHEFKAFIDAGPVTVNNGTGAAYAFLDVRSQGGGIVWTPPLSRIPPSAPQHYELAIGDNLSAGQQYSFTMNGTIFIFFFGGGNAYSEIIARFPKVELRRPPRIPDLPDRPEGFVTAEATRKGGEQGLQARLDKALREHGSVEKAVAALGLKVEWGNGQVVEQEVSLEETLKAGPNGFWSFQA